MRPSFAYVVLSLSLGTIAVWGSEVMFWSAAPADLTLPIFLLTIVMYSVCCAGALSAVLLTGSRGLMALVGGGALLGWLTEGVIVATAYDAFPVQLVWTGLAWHMLITTVAMLGLFRAGPHWPLWQQVLGWTGLGILFGVWAMFWPTERTDLTAAPALYMIGSGVVAIIANIAIDKLGPSLTRPPRWVLWIAPVLLILLWIAQRVAAPNPITLSVPALLILTVWAMRRLGDSQSLPDWRPAPHVWRHGVPVIAPVIATFMAAYGWENFGAVGSNIPIAIGSGLISLILWGWLIWRGVRDPVSAPPSR